MAFIDPPKTETDVLRNALQAAVVLLNSEYVARAFILANVHGFKATADEERQVKNTWDIINAGMKLVAP